MSEFKVGDRVLVPGVVEGIEGYVEDWVRIGFNGPRGASSEPAVVRAGSLTRVPEELPTVPGSIVELSDGINQLAYVGKESWILLGNLKDPTYGCGDLFDSDWVREQGFSVIYDRGAVSDGA